MNLLLLPVIKAVEHDIERYQNSSDKNEKIIYQALMRSKIILERLNICGVDIVGKSYDEFEKYVRNKSNIVFLDDKELDEMHNALRIYRLIEEVK